MIEHYIFVDEEGTVLGECGCLDETVAERKCVQMCKIYKKTITCYKEICKYSLPGTGEPQL